MHSETEIVQRLVRELMGPPPLKAKAALSVVEAVTMMAERRVPFLLLVDANDKPVGIVTEEDIVRRGVFSAPPGQAISTIMSSPVVTIAEGDHLYRALSVMRRRNFSRVPVTAPDGRITGTLEQEGTLWRLTGPTARMVELLVYDDSPEGLRAVKEAEVDLAEALLKDDVPGPDIQLLLSEINADLHRRALAHAMAEMEANGWGPPPVGFSLIMMGSHGRRENFLAPDQDHGMILADYADSEHDRINAYFVPLTERFSRLLHEIGFDLCKGNVMASNPVWRKRLGEWIVQVNGWVDRRTEQQLLLTDILLDFRHAWGDVALTQKLREAVTSAINRKPRFLKDLFSIEADHKVALGWFGGLSKERDDFDRPGYMNLKMRGTLPLVEAARLMCLKAGLGADTTRARLDALRDKGLLDRAAHDYLTNAYALISRLLLREQIACLRSGLEVNDLVPENSLTRREKDQLVASFKQIETLRSGLKLDLSESAM